MHRSHLGAAFRLAGIYILVAGLYIVFSDRLVESLVHDSATLSRLQSVKGVGFVLATGVMLFFLMRFEFARRDASERRAHEHQAHFRALFDSPLVGMVLSRRGGQVIDANSAFERISGLRRADLADGRVNAWSCIPEEYAGAVQAMSEPLEGRGPAPPLAVELLRPDGHRVPVVIGSVRVEHQDDLVASLVLDISAQRELEGRVLHKQKLEAVGLLAGGVAHDFNNLLTAIIGYAELCSEQTPRDTPLHRDLAEISAAGQRAAALTQQLLAFSRRQVLHPQVVEARDVVEHVAPLLRRLAGDAITLVTAFAPEAGAVLVDPGQLEQVLVNLVVNARDAMPDGGRVVIRTEALDVDAQEAALHPGTMAGPHVAISVTDTGIGMDPATLSRVFEPFFTTKDAGRGTGLGLASVHGIVAQSGGHVRATSERGRGTTLTVVLPRAARAPLAAPAARAAEDALAPATGTVLIADGDPALLRLTQSVLAAHGYSVLTAATGGEVTRALQSHPGPLKLAIVEAWLPGTSVGGLIEVLRARHPGLPVLVTSGQEVRLSSAELPPGVATLEKPFRPAELVRRVESLVATHA